ncbi:MAG: alkaline phosphatase family protein [Anaerolineales bacterium]|nr:alkaline phosphatase family protein [Anaerolineales bacterium]
MARGKRLLSAVPYANTCAGLPLLNAADLEAGLALSADFTGEGWRHELGYSNAPVYTPDAAGAQLWKIGLPYDFIFFEHWQTDVDGHEQALTRARSMLQRFDGFLGGLLSAADLDHTMVIVSSDHGNVEDCSHGKHTVNKVLTLIAGDGRQQAAGAITALTDFVPVILDYLLPKSS